MLGIKRPAVEVGDIPRRCRARRRGADGRLPEDAVDADRRRHLLRQRPHLPRSRTPEPEPTLYPEETGGSVNVVAQWADVRCSGPRCHTRSSPPRGRGLPACHAESSRPSPPTAPRCRRTAGCAPTSSTPASRLRHYLGWLEDRSPTVARTSRGSQRSIADFRRRIRSGSCAAFRRWRPISVQYQRVRSGTRRALDRPWTIDADGRAKRPSGWRAGNPARTGRGRTGRASVPGRTSASHRPTTARSGRRPTRRAETTR